MTDVPNEWADIAPELDHLADAAAIEIDPDALAADMTEALRGLGRALGQPGNRRERRAMQHAKRRKGR